MKKRIWMFCFAMLLFSASAFADAEPGTIVTGIEGKAYVVRNGESQALEHGAALEEGDVLRTGADSRVDISMGGRAGVRVLGSSEAVLNKTGAEDMDVKLTVGNVIASLKDDLKKTRFRLETPTAVLAVRGTQFWGRAEKQADLDVTTFAVKRGTVEVTAKSTGGSFTLIQGQAIDIPLDKTVPSVRQAKKDEMAALAQADQIPII